MDAPEEDLDVKLQKASSDLIAEFDRSLGPFLRKPDGAAGLRVRSRVRSRETTRLVSTLLDPFQELPQLLDPHLPKWIPLLAETFLEYLQTRRRSKPLSTRSELLMPLPTAICKFLYTFCKIRGEKVIVRFLNVETRYLELLLTALEDAERFSGPSGAAASSAAWSWSWEERYVVLLWLSHLLLAPFDLSTISSVDADDTERPDIPGLHWPPSVPGLTVRALPVALKYLSSPGKERDAAKAVLVRMAMRRDMQETGILHALVQWALFSLRPSEDTPTQTPYHCIGVLSFLAGILVSSSSDDASDLDRYLTTIFYAVHAVASDEGSPNPIINASALARKMAIKVMRSTAVLVLRKPDPDMAGTELVETTISHLLESLADNDTPVRFAASKALSIITLKLDAGMASQVVEAVLESLNRNVLWARNPLGPSLPRVRDLASVNPLEWHGLMLTLSHLLYRRSPPAENLADIISALLLGLSFERRNTSGGSMGTNVRDAACFGIWAIARRYTTAELLAVPAASVSVSRAHSPDSSVLQILATELVIAACLDPTGNIRRGSSAALQELIGRHPDSVEKGIWIVQTVDYHAVSLRSRAVLEVAMDITKLSPRYGEAILEGLLGWRGIGDADAAARRVAGASFGAITSELAKSDPASSVSVFIQSIGLVYGHLGTLQARQVEERHGLLLNLAAVLKHIAELAADVAEVAAPSGLQPLVSKVLEVLHDILQSCKTTAFRKPELVAEATCRLIVSASPLLQAAVLGGQAQHSVPRTKPALTSGATVEAFAASLPSIDAAGGAGHARLAPIVSLLQENLDVWLLRSEQEAIAAASEAALVLLIFCGAEQRDRTIRQWAGVVRERPTSRASTSTGHGHFFALTMASPLAEASRLHVQEDTSLICGAIVGRWAGDKDIETRTAILQSITQSEILRHNAADFLGLISEGLDDYTTNARGDIGSHVRLQALRATKRIWEALGDVASATTDASVVSRIFLPVLRLAAEKLDRVRVEAQSTLALALQPSSASAFTRSTFSSQGYFAFLLGLLGADDALRPPAAAARSSSDGWMDALMAGYVTSADTGNEDLVIASRAALAEHCAASAQGRDRVCAALWRNLRARQGQDRVVVPTLEVAAFLFHAGAFQRCAGVDHRNLCLQVQKASYKTGNVRKLEACAKVYGGIAGLAAAAGGAGPTGPGGSAPEEHRREAAREARKRLGALLVHPWPRIRSVVVDELWLLVGAEDEAKAERLKGVDWGRAAKGDIKALVEALALG